MAEDDHDALAAEYVLGTLSADERGQAQALIGIDPGFAEVVRQWERRLGELHVMVEAIEPPPEVWDKIKTDVRTLAPKPAIESPPVAAAVHEPPKAPELPAASPLASLASSLLSPEPVPQPEPETRVPKAAADLSAALLSVAAPPKEAGRSADVIYLAGRVKRWQRMTLALGTLAALLALFVAASIFGAVSFAPTPSSMIVRAVRSQQDRLVAVLQQGPVAPAFLVTMDTQNRTLTVRRVAATVETGRSYELWLISSRLGNPRSLGVVGNDEFTQRALPRNYDIDTLKTASYAVSLEPAGGSPSGAPTGPVLFTGKAFESLPDAPPPT